MPSCCLVGARLHLWPLELRGSVCDYLGLQLADPPAQAVWLAGLQHGVSAQAAAHERPQHMRTLRR